MHHWANRMDRWWLKIDNLDHLADDTRFNNITGVHLGAGSVVHSTALLDTSQGPIVLGEDCRICEYASLTGPLIMGARCLVGKGAQVRQPSVIGDDVLIGQNAEVKRAMIGNGVNLGPSGYACDSWLEDGVFFAALVRTSNFRLDDRNVQVLHHGQRVDSGMKKLGCWVGKNTRLGIGCKIYPGRVVPPDALFEMDIHIRTNLPSGHYRLQQVLEAA